MHGQPENIIPPAHFNDGGGVETITVNKIATEHKMENSDIIIIVINNNNNDYWCGDVT